MKQKQDEKAEKDKESRENDDKVNKNEILINEDINRINDDNRYGGFEFFLMILVKTTAESLKLSTEFKDFLINFFVWPKLVEYRLILNFIQCGFDIVIFPE